MNLLDKVYMKIEKWDKNTKGRIEILPLVVKMTISSYLMNFLIASLRLSSAA